MISAGRLVEHREEARLDRPEICFLRNGDGRRGRAHIGDAAHDAAAASAFPCRKRRAVFAKRPGVPCPSPLHVVRRDGRTRRAPADRQARASCSSKALRSASGLRIIACVSGGNFLIAGLGGALLRRLLDRGDLPRAKPRSSPPMRQLSRRRRPAARAWPAPYRRAAGSARRTPAAGSNPSAGSGRTCGRGSARIASPSPKKTSPVMSVRSLSMFVHCPTTSRLLYS